VSEIGTIKTVTDRGFCFIRPDVNDGRSKDIFAHMSEFEKAGLRKPEVGERFEYEIQMTPKGPQAINIAPVM
jgi:cold shock protein